MKKRGLAKIFSKRTWVMCLISVMMLTMVMGCANANETQETSGEAKAASQLTVSSDEINDSLESVYSGMETSDSVIADIESYLKNSYNGYDIDVTNVDASNFPQISIYYTLYDNTGSKLPVKNRSNFVIIEEDSNGNETMQMVSTLKAVAEDEISNVCIAMDVSRSMRVNSNIDYLNEAVIKFVQSMSMSDMRTASLIAFSSQIVSYVPFTSDQDEIIKEVNSLQADGKTALYDSIYYAMKTVNEQEGQKYVIAFTDGADNCSAFGYRDIIEISKELGIPIYIIGLGSSLESEYLEKIASESGGEYMAIKNMKNVYEMFAAIYKEQIEQYVLTYTTLNTTEQDFWRTLTVHYIGDDQSASALAQYNPAKSVTKQYSDTAVTDLGSDDDDTVVNQNEFIGIWEGYYYNNSGEMDLTLEITEITDSGEVSATFSFTPSDNPGEAGRTGTFTMKGYIDSTTNMVYLDGTEWLTEAPDGYGTLSIYGEIYDNTFNGYFYRDYKPKFYLAKQ